MKIKAFSKRIAAVVLSVSVLASAVVLQNLAVNADAGSGSAASVWDGTKATSLSGSGTAADPYKITNGAELAFAVTSKYNVSNGKHYVLTNDIYLNDVSAADWYTKAGVKEWIYGCEVNDQHKFSGILDGKGYSVKGIYIDDDTFAAAAVAEGVTAPATVKIGLIPGNNGYFAVKNLGIESSYIVSNSEYVGESNPGSLVGAFMGVTHNWAQSSDGFLFENCFVDSSVILKGAFVGGFVGRTVYKTHITNCLSDAQITTTKCAGSFIGDAFITWAYNNVFVHQCVSGQATVEPVGNAINVVDFQKSYTAASSRTGLTKLTREEMTGSNAAANMTALYFPQLWTAREGKLPWPTAFEQLGPDAAAPAFSGEIGVYGMSEGSAAVVWKAASDERTIPDKIVYTVYKSAAPITDVTAAGVDKCGSFSGVTDASVTGLALGNKYYFAVTASDEVGNASAALCSAEYSHSYSSVDAWDGTVASGFVLGNGTKENPYKIMNAEQLAYLAKLCKNNLYTATAGKYYTLTVDINLNDTSVENWQDNDPKEWEFGAFEDKWRSFGGTLDGQGHIIKGLYISDTADNFNGLFSSIDGSATIKNLGIEDSYILADSSANTYAGAFAGYRTTTAGSGVGIEACYSSDSVVIEAKYAGGIFGTTEQKTSFTNSYSQAQLTAAEAAGTLVGAHTGAKTTVYIDGCYSSDAEIDMIGKLSENAVVSYNNSYSVLSSAKGLAKIATENMLGSKAKSYMGTFDFASTWLAQDGLTPRLALFVPKAVWSGDTATAFAGGTGSSTDPYQIANAEQLAYLLKIVNTGDYSATFNKHYKLTADIYLNSITGSTWYTGDGVKSWPGTGNSFAGSLDGDGHVIHGIYINDTNATNGGLFAGLVAPGVAIKRLGIEDSYIKVKENAGAFAGNGESWGSVVFEECYSSDTVILSANSKTGGIIGNDYVTSSFTLSFKNCYSSAQLISGSNKGGLLGYNFHGTSGLTLTNCYNTQAGVRLVGGFPEFASFNSCYSVGAAQTGITALTLEQMQGSAAKSNMSAFDFVTKDNQNATWYTLYGKAPQLKVFNDSDIDLIDPTFEGEIELLERSQVYLSIGWPMATDNYTASEFIEYAVYYSANKITKDNVGAANVLGTFTAANEATLSSISLGDKYYFAVAAIDGTGNATYIFSDKAFETKKSKTGETWSGEVARGYEAGTGTADDPYIIATAEQLAYLVEKMGSKNFYYKLAADIILNDTSKDEWKKNATEWFPGTSSDESKAFSGVLDGDGHIVKGIYIDDAALNASGLFSVINGKAEIHNLGIIESDIAAYGSGSMAGAFVGYQKPWATGDGIKLINCFADETVLITGETYAGGLLGGIIHNKADVHNTTTFLNCYTGAQVSASSNANKGSFVGRGYLRKDGVIFENCFSNIALLKFVATECDYAIFKNCYSFGTVYDGITKVSNMDMLGKNADKFMDLDYTATWVTTEKGSPMLRVFGDHPEYAIDRLPITVTLETNGGNELEPLVGYTGDKITLPTPVREGYVFEGWYVYNVLDVKYPLDTYPGYDLTLYAKWRDLAALRVDFENYPYTEAGEDGLGEDYELYRPGVDNYDAKFVNGGGRSMHRIGDSAEASDFQLFDVDSTPLEAGKTYQLSMWIYADSVSEGTIQLVSSDRIKLSKKSQIVVADVADVQRLEKGKWQQVVVTFTAQGKYLRVRTPGLCSLYFDDIDIYDTGSYSLSPSTGVSRTADAYLAVAAVIALAAIALAYGKKRYIKVK